MMKKLILWLKTYDKIAHLLIGALLGLLSLPLMWWNLDKGLVLSLLFSSLIFFTKELFDKFKKQPTGFSWSDLFCDYVGWGIGIFVSGILLIII